MALMSLCISIGRVVHVVVQALRREAQLVLAHFSKDGSGPVLDAYHLRRSPQHAIYHRSH